MTDQMREVDRTMMQDMGITLMQMMENAGRHLAALTREGPGSTVERKRVVVLAGRGNNGGGMVAARHLANWGAEVSVILTASPDDYHDVPEYQLGILRNMEVPISPVPWNKAFRGDLILDAIIGYGLRGAPMGIVAAAIEATNDSGIPILALDAPSGLDTTTGIAHDQTIRAQATLTLAFPKVGLFTASARAFVGELYLADISVPTRVYTGMGLAVPNVFQEAKIVHLDSRQNHS